MRKIERLARSAFEHGVDFRRDNTEVRVDRDRVTMYLHGHAIARRPVDSEHMFVTLARHNTMTTRSRLNGAVLRLGARVYTRDFTPYLRTVTGEVVELDSRLWYCPITGEVVA